MYLNIFSRSKSIFRSDILALSGLTYQTLELLNKFMERKTIVNIQFEMLPEHDHPAISVCVTPAIVTPFRSAKIDPEFGTAWQEWEEMVTKLETLYKDKGLFGQINRTRFHRTYTRTLSLWKELQRNYSSGKSGFDDILSNYSIKTNDIGISIIVNGPVGSTMTQSVFSDLQYFNFSNHPIERFDGIREKCFIYFSMVSLNKTHLIDRYVDQISLIIIPRAKHYGLGFLPRIRISFHSPNIVPNLDKSMIEITSFSIIYFSQTIINRYQSGYDTDCFDYSNGQFTSRHDCLVDCLYYLYHGTFRNGISSFKLNKNDLANFLLRNTEYVDNRCKKKCKIECQSAYYRFDQVDRMGAQVFSAEDNNDIIQSYAKGIQLTSLFRHSSSPDLLVCHYPEVTLLSLMCNFGGLLGMWTGLSVLLICRETLRKLRNIANNFNFYWVKMKNTFNYNTLNVKFGPISINNRIDNHHHFTNGANTNNGSRFVPIQITQHT